MKILFIVVLIIFIVVSVVSFIVANKQEKEMNKRKNEFIEHCSDDEQKLIRAYIEHVKGSKNK